MITVESPGLQTTVQDLGRWGYGPLGISASGAADPVALRAGNLLVGNAPGAPALEMTLIGGRYRFQRRVIATITGASFAARLGENSLDPWTAFEVPAGGLLEIGSGQSGARAYLCVRGGIQVAPFLGSASTHVMTGLGGFRGRALKKSDVLEVGPAGTTAAPRSIRAEILAQLAARKTIRITEGCQFDWFTTGTRASFAASPYRVTQEANRMGLRLSGSAVPCSRSSNMITEGVPLGAVQIPANGQPIILFVEQQTTGGYPKIASVISADLSSVGQLRPGDEVRFEWVSLYAARELLREQERLLSPEELLL